LANNINYLNYVPRWGTVSFHMECSSIEQVKRI